MTLAMELVTKPHKCCGRCGLTPADVAKYKRWGEEGECRDMCHTKYDHHIWIWWDPEASE